ncbi:site-2 protease family protein [Terasakiella sp.]|uniref:site-2 protease family protein n=1 Tax=Terasakiella sp. TaxID=2034861 RepID=UPI003AA974B0
MTQSASWQSLREDLDLHEGAPAYDGQPTWVIEDPATNRFFQLDRKGFEVLCRWHLGDAELIAQEVNKETSQTVSKDFVDGFGTFLIQNQLVRLSQGKSVETLTKQRKKKQTWYLWLLHHYLFFRVPLVKPDRFLQATLKYVRPLYSKGVFYVLLFSLAAGLFLVSRQWDVFITSFVDMLSVKGLVYFIIALSISKIGHELGHAYTAKLYGCRVPAMGVAFLVLWPMLYTDTNQTWKIKSRRKRLNVGAAGMCVELGFAAIATLAWSFLPNGAWRDMALVTATTTWVSSLLINISPFMRFDGYYLMSDWLGMPNLHQRSFALGRWKMREILFNLNHPVPEKFKPKKQLFLILFAYGVWIYRLTLFLGIAVLVYSFFIKLIGILLFVIEILWFVLKPVFNELKVWYGLREQIKGKKRGYIGLAGCFLLFGMAFIPWSTGVTASAIVKAGEATEIYSQFSGILQDKIVHEGQTVQAGEILTRLQDPDLVEEEQVLIYRKKRLEYEQTLTALSADYRGQSDSIYANLVQLDVEQNILNERKQALMLKAPHDGVWLDSETGLSPGQWIGVGQHLGRITSFEQLKLNAYVLERDMERISTQSSCAYYSLAAPKLRYDCKILEIEKFPTRLLHQKELATMNGGLITVRQDEAGLHPDESIYKVILELDETKVPAIAHSGLVRFSGKSESLMFRLYRFVARSLIEESAW